MKNPIADIGYKANGFFIFHYSLYNSSFFSFFIIN